jgi:mannose-1-phosphate guanylyltransferase/mannose-6-phosphate isomerase
MQCQAYLFGGSMDVSLLEPVGSGTVTVGDSSGLVVPVILSGGCETRLWPVSRDSFPQQLWPLVSDKSLLQDTALRASAVEFAAPIVVCNEAHRFLIAEQLREAGIQHGRIVLEPCVRDSGPAIAAAAMLVAETNRDAILWVMPADASIRDGAALHEALVLALAAAKAGNIVTFGVTPSAPETSYGYIEVGDALAGLGGAMRVANFVEKPGSAAAAAMVSRGSHLWNSGMFVFKAETMLSEMREHAPAVICSVERAVAGRTMDLDFVRLDRAAFAASPSISVGCAVAEKTWRAAVVPVDLGWSDVGSWNALWELGEKDSAGNVVVGDVVLEASSDCYARSDGMLTAVVGLTGVVVVTTEDAVLVMHRDRAQDAKRVVERLRACGRPEADAHNRCYRPWGFYERLIGGNRFQVKRIVVKPGNRLSLQKHFHRAEHWVVVAGTALVTRDDECVLVQENESIYLPLGCVHRLENPGRISLELIEVQSGSYLGEDDIVRLDDVYGRC